VLLETGNTKRWGGRRECWKAVSILEKITKNGAFSSFAISGAPPYDNTTTVFIREEGGTIAAELEKRKKFLMEVRPRERQKGKKKGEAVGRGKPPSSGVAGAED